MVETLLPTQPIQVPELPKIVFNCNDTIRSPHSVVCTREWLDKKLDDPMVESNCVAYQMGNDEAKKNLPVIYPQATFIDGHRTDANAIESGLVMLDVDDHDGSQHFNPQAFFDFYIQPKLKDEFKHVLMVYVTASGRGLRIIAKRQSQRSLRDEQAYLFHTVCKGMPDEMLDTTACNASRASYLAPRSYMLHLDYEELFGGCQDEAFANGMETLEEVSESETSHDNLSDQTDSANANELPILPEVRAKISEDGVLYGDIPYEDIKTELLMAIKATGKKSTRNPKTYELACHLRHICRTEDHLLSLMPNWGLSADEVKQIVRSAVKSFLPDMPVPQLLKSIIDRLSDAETSADEAPVMPASKDLPRAINVILQPYPEQRKAALAISALPALGTLATRVRCYYDNTEVHSLSFISCLVAPPGCYKGSMPKLYKRLLRPVIDKDEATREQIKEWRDEQVAIGESAKKQKNPHFEIRDLAPRTTYAALIEYMGNAKGKHLCICAPEIDFIAHQKDNWIREGSVLRCAFDNERIGQDAKGVNAANGYGDLYLNACISGTPKSVLSFFRSPENGLVSRVLFSIYPDTSGQKKNPDQRRTPANERELDEIINRLMAEGDDWDYNENPIELPKLQDEIDKWLEVKRELFNMTQNHAIDDFRKRAAVVGYRAGVLAFILENHRLTKKALNFALWVAEYVLWAQVNLFGKQMNECANDNREILYKKSSSTNNIIFLNLPEVFKTSDVTRLYLALGMSGSGARKTCTRWAEDGYIEHLDARSYRKTTKGTEIANRLKQLNDAPSLFSAGISA